MSSHRVLILTKDLTLIDHVTHWKVKKYIPQKSYDFFIEHYNAPPPQKASIQYLTPDFEDFNTLKPIIRVIKDRCIQYETIVPMDEHAVLAAAYLCQALSIQGFGLEASRPFRDKHRMKALLRQYDIPAPPVYTIQDIQGQSFQFPLIIKPKDGAGAIDTHLINSSEEQLSDVTLKEDYIIEAFIDAPIYHIDGIVWQKELQFLTVCQYQNTWLDYRQGIPLVSTTIARHLWEDWKEYVMQLLEKLNPPPGAFHLEAFETKLGEKLFLEMGIRPGGYTVPQLLESATGVHIKMCHLNCRLGWYPQLLLIPPQRHAGRVCIPFIPSERAKKEFAQQYERWQNKFQSAHVEVVSSSSYPLKHPENNYTIDHAIRNAMTLIFADDSLDKVSMDITTVLTSLEQNLSFWKEYCSTL